MLRRLLLVSLALACLASSLGTFGQAQVNDPEVTKGIRLVEDGDYDAAILTLDGAARRLSIEQPDAADLPQAYLYLGIAFVGKGYEAAAKAKFRAAIAQMKDLSLGADRFPPKVINVFEAAREEMGPPSQAAASSGGDAPAATRPHALPTSIPAASADSQLDRKQRHQELTRLLSRQQWPQLETRARDAIRTHPEVAQFHSLLAGALAAQHRLDEAEAEYRECTRLAPDAGWSHFWLAHTLTAERKWADADREFQEAIRVEPWNDSWRIRWELMRYYGGLPRPAQPMVKGRLDMSVAIDGPNARTGLIWGVQPGGAAHKAGLQAGDIVVEYDGRPVSSNANLLKSVAASQAGRRVMLKVRRGGQELLITATVLGLERP
jgi:tetratricopeptide (TPR) repeat protein